MLVILFLIKLTLNI